MCQPERGCLYVFLRAIAVGVILLFVPLAVAVLIVFNLERQVFNPNVYKSALDQQGVYERAPVLFAGEMARSSASGEAAPSALANLSPADMRAILEAILPPGWLKAQTESAIDQFFAMLESDGPPRVMVSLAEVKQRLAGPAGVEALHRLADSWPECSAEQVAQAQQVIAAGGELSSLPACSPPADFRDRLDPLLERAAARMARDLPAETNLADIFQRGTIQDPRPAIRLARQIIAVSPALPVLLLLLVVALAVRQPKDLNTWWGIPLLIVGMIGFVAALALTPLREWAILYFVPAYADTPETLRDVVGRVTQVISQRAALLIGAESAFVGMAGFMLLVFGFSIWREDRVPARR